MLETFWELLGAILALIGLGLLASFSPSLYLLISAATRIRTSFPYLVAVLVGIVGGMIFLSVLFQFFTPTTLQSLFNSTVTSLFISTWFRVLMGTLLIIGGIVYYKKRAPNAPHHDSKLHKKGLTATASLGFIRTVFSLTGITAIFIASNLIADSATTFAQRLIMVSILLVAAVGPFLALYGTFKHFPASLDKATNYLKQITDRRIDRPIVSGLAVFIGSIIILIALVG